MPEPLSTEPLSTGPLSTGPLSTALSSAQRLAAPQEAATLAEIFAGTSTDGAATGFVLARLAAEDRPVLWIQDRLSRREAGRPSPAGFPRAMRLLHLAVSRPVDVLWAMEQGLDCRALGAVVGEVWGEAPALDFTATKRLALRAEAQGLACWLIRRAAAPDLSAARERWHLASLPSERDMDDPRAPGPALWRASLFRARFRAPGDWVARPDPATGALALLHGTEAAARPAQAAG